MTGAMSDALEEGFTLAVMPSSRLQRWQLIGLALTVIWALVSSAYLYSGYVEHAGDASYATNRECLARERVQLRPDAFLPEQSFAKCSKEARDTHYALIKGKWIRVALIALAPAIAWLLAYGLIGLVRQIRSGPT